MMFVDLAPGMPLVQAGKIRSLGVLTQRRLGSNPELPTAVESANGAISWAGWACSRRAARQTPSSRRSTRTRRLFQDATERMNALGVDMKWTTPQEMRDWIDTQLNDWKKTAKSAGIVPQ